MRLRGMVWVVAAGVAAGSASWAAAASSSIDAPARVLDRAQRVDAPFEVGLTPQQRSIVEMVTLVNAERSSRGLPSLRLDERASEAARAHAADMAAMRRLQHAGSDGSDGGTRLRRAGYTWTAWGENIGAGFLEPGPLVDSWMSSAGHRVNLLGDFTDVGVGVATTEDGVPYWSLVVARAN